ncbi:hypothetical protein [Bacillus mycoides]|uniref:hypothetical protein n=1 Tax=Bacillus mycoides TaxID=1405 RepID=UPI002930C42E|nr:hypothetical protein [Bacillus mycoides]WOA61053.1 hypothetical protein RVY74_31890 [Bacillus mycoides]
MEDSVKLFGEDGMLQMALLGKKVMVFNIEGYLTERITTKEQAQELIIFLEECKEQME